MEQGTAVKKNTACESQTKHCNKRAACKDKTEADCKSKTSPPNIDLSPKKCYNYSVSYEIKTMGTLMQDTKEKGKGFAVLPLVAGGAEVAVLFLPVVFLTVPLLYLVDGEAALGLISVAPPVAAAVLGCFVLLDRSARQAMLKWIFSLPFSAVFWVYFVNSRFLIRMCNFVYPSFGEGWTGDGLGIMLVLGTALFAGGIGVATGMYLSQYKTSEKLRKTALILQKTLCPIVCGAIFITVIILSIIMPDHTLIPG